MMKISAKKLLMLAIVLLGSSPMLQAASKPHRPPSAPLYRWCMRSGETLKSVLERWGKQAVWVVQWQTSYDYPIPVATCLTGNFVSVLQTVSQAYQQAEQPLYFDVYPKQRLLVVTP